jgi:hypothetical protein
MSGNIRRYQAGSTAILNVKNYRRKKTGKIYIVKLWELVGVL